MNTTLYVVPDSVVPSITKGEMMSGPISDVAIGEFYFSSAFGLGMLLSGRGGEPVMVGDEYDTIIISGPDLLPELATMSNPRQRERLLEDLATDPMAMILLSEDYDMDGNDLNEMRNDLLQEIAELLAGRDFSRLRAVWHIVQ